jgi:hypothetical protein
MKIISNPKKIERNYKIGMYTTLVSLVFLIGAVALTVPGMINIENAKYSTYSPLAMLIGLITSQVGVYYANRYGKSPRVDERITQSLKGLDDRYTLYHYATPVPHLLAGPTGFWILTAQYMSGTITFEKNRYRQQGVGFFARYIGQEGVSRPDMEAEGQKADFIKFVKKNLPETELPRIESLIVFTNPKANVQAQDAPIPTIHVEKLKDYIRRLVKEKPNADKVVQKVQEILPEEDIE